MGKLRNYRKDVTESVEAAKKLFTKSDQPPKELKDVEEALTEARNQVIKYGFLSFLAAPAITEESKAGETARTSLQSVWDVHKVNKDILKYLGDDLCNRVQAVLAEHGDDTKSAAKRVAAGVKGARKRQRSAA